MKTTRSVPDREDVIQHPGVIGDAPLCKRCEAEPAQQRTIRGKLITIPGRLCMAKMSAEGQKRKKVAREKAPPPAPVKSVAPETVEEKASSTSVMVRLTPPMRKRLFRLLETGFYGMHLAETVERVLASALQGGE